MDTFDVRTAASLLSVSTKTVYRLVAKGKLTAARVGGQLRFTRLDLDTYLKNNGSNGFKRAASDVGR